MSGRVDWPALAAFAFGRLGLAPAAFWAMTPAELEWAARGAGATAQAPMGRAGLKRLMARHPDRTKDEEHG